MQSEKYVSIHFVYCLSENNHTYKVSCKTISIHSTACQSVYCAYQGQIKQYRDVTTGATGATEVAPKFSDTLHNHISTKGGRFYPPLQRSQLKNFHGYVPVMYHSSVKSNFFIFSFVFFWRS